MEISPQLLLQAYANGYFPMAESTEGRIAWYKPDPRAILPLDGFHVSHSLAKTLRQGLYKITFDRVFPDVIAKCAAREETWISSEIRGIYTHLYQLGFCHSVEAWDGETLAGGLYGVALGGAFFAESKFHVKRDASKVALHALVERLKKKGFTLLEVQFLTPHLASLGAIEIPLAEYERRLHSAVRKEASF